MRSGERSEPLDLERGLPTSAEDVRALRRARDIAPLDTPAYLEFLAQLARLSPSNAAGKRGPRGVPFVLRG